MDGGSGDRGLWRNDVHGGLNPTCHARIERPRNPGEVADLLGRATRAGQRVAIAGAGYAMGGQQWAEGGWLVDSRGLRGVLDYDGGAGLVRVGAGTLWPELQAFLAARRRPDGKGWAIRQKQTGADNLSLGGALGSNIHGRGLDCPPFVADLERFRMVLPEGRVAVVDREREPELFAHAVGGYGLFGVATDLELRLVRREALVRRVRLARRDELAQAFGESIAAGARYGDFQFSIDPDGPDFLDLGVYACYHPDGGPLPEDDPALELSARDWRELMWLAHVDKRAAFERYSRFYLATDGQRYASDDHQFGVYLDGYHAEIDQRLGHRGSEVITELYVPLEKLAAFLARIAGECREHRVDVVYGTVRLIRRDEETVLAWARQDSACVVLNLHVAHDPAGRAKAAADFRRLIDAALAFGGSYYLTYHRHATAQQLRTAYPAIDAFVAEKERRDPRGVLASDWYRALRATLGTSGENMQAA